MSVIFYHRVKIKRLHFMVSAVMPYLFILFLGVLKTSGDRQTFTEFPISQRTRRSGCRAKSSPG